MKRLARTLIFVLLTAAWLLDGCTRRSTEVSFPARMVDAPAAAGSAEPNLYYAASDGRTFLSWIEPAGEAHTLRFSVRTADGWSDPKTIAQGNDWFVNWADFPSMAVSAEGALLAHWLQKSGEATYAYDVRVSRSTDGGETWSEGLTPHRDGTKTEHGFVSMLPWSAGGMLIVWLDGRNMAGAAGDHRSAESEEAQMTLRMAVMAPDGGLREERALDERVCDCCQTSAALTNRGAIVVYRDRSPEEIRDISFVRFRDGRWTRPRSVAEDGWEIYGCPVNGPAIAAMGARVAVVWFTNAGEVPKVNIAFSNDEGETFDPPLRVDDGDPMGRVDVILLPDGSALASWMEFTGDAADIRIRRVWSDGRAEDSRTLVQSSKERASGFPVMVSNDREVLIAWTDVGTPSRVRTASLRID